MDQISEQDLWRFIDGDLSDEELDAIAKAIAEDESVRALYERLLAMHMRLEHFFKVERQIPTTQFKPDFLSGRGQN